MYTLYGSKYFSVVDSFSGFWQFRIAEKDKIKTAFCTPSGHFQFQRLPYGLSNSPASFQRLMDIVSRNLTGKERWVYIDDVIIFSGSIDEHERRLERVLQRFEKANVRLQPQKFFFAQTQVEYLGCVVSREGIKPSPEKTKAVRNYPTPLTVKEVRSFVWLAPFYRRLIPKFPEKAKPLTELLRKDAKFVWTDRQNDAFKTLE
jgi:hypothetical protein